ncbi:MAG: integrase arm-type DNA-binding domain-containing protein [Henriciella sp.]
MPLTDTHIKRLKPSEKETKHADGGGLTLLVKPNGSKLWRLRYRFDGKQKDLSLGKYPAVSLAAARSKRSDAKALLADGIDPRAHEDAEKEEAKAISEDTFGRIAAELMEKLTKEGKAETTLRKKQWYLDMANADFADMPIRDLSSAIVLKTLRKVEAKGNYETAQRLRSTIGQVCRYAIATARLDNDPTYALRGALVSPQVKHQPAITDREGFAQVVRDVWSYGGGLSTNAALKLMVLLYPRPGELRKATWSEFDLEAATWTIPAEHEKNRRTHEKPLPELALEILRELKAHSGYGDLVFPTNSNPKKPLSENAINQALQRLGYKGAHTSHGFRASASSLLNESGLWNEDAIETELCHIERSQSRRPYNRSKYWDERVKMADWWAEEIAVMLR